MKLAQPFACGAQALIAMCMVALLVIACGGGGGASSAAIRPDASPFGTSGLGTGYIRSR